MTESSGVFTFPTTGIYLIQFVGQHNTSGSINWSQTEIHNTTDNGTYNSVAFGYASLWNGGSYQSSLAQFKFDVTNTSTHKMTFQTDASDSGASVTGVSGRFANVLFIRLGDT